MYYYTSNNIDFCLNTTTIVTAVCFGKAI